MSSSHITRHSPERYWRARIDTDSRHIILFGESPLLQVYGGLVLLSGLAIALNLITARLSLGISGWLLVMALLLAGAWLLRYSNQLRIDLNASSRTRIHRRLLGGDQDSFPLGDIDTLLVRHVRDESTFGHLFSRHVLYAIEGDQLVQWATSARRAPLEHQAQQLAELFGCPLELEPHTLQDTLLSLLFKGVTLIALAALIAAIATFLHLAQAIKVALASLFFAALFVAGLWGIALLLKRIARGH